MSSIGTGIATGVASVAQAAQQASRARDKNSGDVQKLARDEADRFEHQLQAAAQADDPDAELPDHQSLGYEQLYQDGDGQPASESPTDPEADEAPANQAPDAPMIGPQQPLYQHLDIKA